MACRHDARRNARDRPYVDRLLRPRCRTNRLSEYGRENQLRDKLTWAPPAWLHAKRFKHDPREHNICPGTEAPASCHHPFAPSLVSSKFVQLFWKEMAGTTRLELATSAVTAQRFDVID